jgi:hypothetical protein
MAQTEMYKGKQVSIEVDADPPSVMIDGKVVDVRKTAGGLWFTPDIGHRNFASPLEIAKALVDRMG